MAGDIGTKLYADVAWGTYQPGEPLEVYPGVYVVSRSYNQGGDIYSYTCAADGHVVGVGSAGIANNGYLLYLTQPVLVGPGVIAVWTYQQYYYHRINVFSVSQTGVLALINTYQWSTGGVGIPTGYPIKIAGTVFALTLRDNGTDGSIMIRTFNISADGMTISYIGAGPNVDLGGSIGSHFVYVAGTVYAILCSAPAGIVSVRTYNITAAGVVTFLNTVTLESGATYVAISPRLCRVKNAVWAAVYKIGTPATWRIRTFTMNDSGTFGSVIDTKDSLWGTTGSSEVYQLFAIPAGAFLLSWGGTGGCVIQTISISDAGVIGTTLDTLAGVSGYVVYLIPYSGFPVSGNLYSGFYVNGSWDRKLISVNITLGVSYDPGARVSGIRHVYRPGSYRAELTFGDISMNPDMIKSSVVLPAAPTATEEEKKTTELARTVELTAKTAREGIAALEAAFVVEKGLVIAKVAGTVLKGITTPAKIISSGPGPAGNLNRDLRTFSIRKEEKPMELNIKKTEAAFNKFGYTTADIQAMVKKGMKPAEILAIISESKKSRGTTGGHEVIE